MKTYESIEECTCPVCGKIFIPAPMHQYKDKHTTNKRVCSWACVRESERRRDAEREKRKGN